MDSSTYLYALSSVGLHSQTVITMMSWTRLFCLKLGISENCCSVFQLMWPYGAAFYTLFPCSWPLYQRGNKTRKWILLKHYSCAFCFFIFIFVLLPHSCPACPLWEEFMGKRAITTPRLSTHNRCHPAPISKKTQPPDSSLAFLNPSFFVFFVTGDILNWAIPTCSATSEKDCFLWERLVGTVL